MKVFGISDLHLAISVEDKNMDLFGPVWEDYMNKIAQNWSKEVCSEDIVIVPGDISWAMKIEKAYEDFKYIESLPGKKLIFKGNHDYWWSTGNKLNNFIKNNNLNTISFIQNSCYMVKQLGIAVCGTRGWKNPWDNNFSKDDNKIYAREIIRLEMSLNTARSIGAEQIIAALHFPPFLPEDPKEGENEILELLIKYGVKTCIFGHVHLSGEKDREKWSGFLGKPRNICGINFYLVSSDMNSFSPVRIL